MTITSLIVSFIFYVFARKNAHKLKGTISEISPRTLDILMGSIVLIVTLLNIF